MTSPTPGVLRLDKVSAIWTTPETPMAPVEVTPLIKRTLARLVAVLDYPAVPHLRYLRELAVLAMWEACHACAHLHRAVIEVGGFEALLKIARDDWLASHVRLAAISCIEEILEELGERSLERLVDVLLTLLSPKADTRLQVHSAHALARLACISFEMRQRLSRTAAVSQLLRNLRHHQFAGMSSRTGPEGGGHGAGGTNSSAGASPGPPMTIVHRDNATSQLRASAQQQQEEEEEEEDMNGIPSHAVSPQPSPSGTRATEFEVDPEGGREAESRRSEEAAPTAALVPPEDPNAAMDAAAAAAGVLVLDPEELEWAAAPDAQQLREAVLSAILNLSVDAGNQVLLVQKGVYTLISVRFTLDLDEASRQLVLGTLANCARHPDNFSLLYKAELRCKVALTGTEGDADVDPFYADGPAVVEESRTGSHLELRDRFMRWLMEETWDEEAADMMVLSKEQSEFNELQAHTEKAAAQTRMGDIYALVEGCAPKDRTWKNRLDEQVKQCMANSQFLKYRQSRVHTMKANMEMRAARRSELADREKQAKVQECRESTRCVALLQSQASEIKRSSSPMRPVSQPAPGNSRGSSPVPGSAKSQLNRSLEGVFNLAQRPATADASGSRAGSSPGAGRSSPSSLRPSTPQTRTPSLKATASKNTLSFADSQLLSDWPSTSQVGKPEDEASPSSDHLRLSLQKSFQKFWDPKNSTGCPEPWAPKVKEYIHPYCDCEELHSSRQPRAPPKILITDRPKAAQALITYSKGMQEQDTAVFVARFNEPLPPNVQVEHVPLPKEMCAAPEDAIILGDVAEIRRASTVAHTRSGSPETPQRPPPSTNSRLSNNTRFHRAAIVASAVTGSNAGGSQQQQRRPQGADKEVVKGGGQSGMTRETHIRRTMPRGALRNPSESRTMQKVRAKLAQREEEKRWEAAERARYPQAEPRPKRAGSSRSARIREGADVMHVMRSQYAARRAAALGGEASFSSVGSYESSRTPLTLSRENTLTSLGSEYLPEPTPL
ncbi:hypothetical protein CYMTET_54741 [Cymbomonas tetramitiformis]|uniref:Uncharacterized protein n=1 Tax=Cymbomonas tetramitiformis TaxID=36881 RepID=A0AAE0BEK1_9CHLO|nr:hypothetical protein CYMTET_54741 [Cymbomonas tetramitiformis]